jgi:sec-independent protein translocase protein TatA
MPLSPPADLFGEQGIIVLVVVALVLFGSTQIPKLARSLGSAQKEFKKGLEEGGSEGKSAAKGAENSAAPANPPVQAQGPADGSGSASASS